MMPPAFSEFVVGGGEARGGGRERGRERRSAKRRRSFGCLRFALSLSLSFCSFCSLCSLSLSLSPMLCFFSTHLLSPPEEETRSPARDGGSGTHVALFFSFFLFLAGSDRKRGEKTVERISIFRSKKIHFFLDPLKQNLLPSNHLPPSPRTSSPLYEMLASSRASVAARTALPLSGGRAAPRRATVAVAARSIKIASAADSSMPKPKIALAPLRPAAAPAAPRRATVVAQAASGPLEG